MTDRAWTLDALKEHLEHRIQAVADRALERHTTLIGSIDKALTAAERATTKAEDASKEKFKGVNEFRRALDDYERTLYPRKEAELRLEGIDRRVTAVEFSLTGAAGKETGVKIGYAWAVAVVALISAILSIVSTVIALNGGIP